jgi:hypothetical protein
MTVTPVQHEPTRYWVTSESDPSAAPYLVDLDNDGQATCSCAIIHNRTDTAAECKHIPLARGEHIRRKILAKLPLRYAGDFRTDPNPL